MNYDKLKAKLIANGINPAQFILLSRNNQKRLMRLMVRKPNGSKARDYRGPVYKNQWIPPKVTKEVSKDPTLTQIRSTERRMMRQLVNVLNRGGFYNHPKSPNTLPDQKRMHDLVTVAEFLYRRRTNEDV